ncbi:MAG TPA: hypothetical protein VIW64_18345 [Pyrinomonadaceae bacterium]|jgi:hypothetical protein
MPLRVIHVIAPMKIKYLKSILAAHKRRAGVALLFLICLNLAVFSSSFAQLKNPRRVTALQLGAAAEGSRVTLLADSPLNDYEAFRRGDRFYVKIPLADFMSALPHFRADGFESVQVQKTGDSLIVSFKLQPGATARINQYGNRLDVVFSAPNKSNSIANAPLNPGGNLGGPGTASLRNTSDRGPDAAGPMPPRIAGSSGSREGVVSEAGSDQGANAWRPSFQNSRRGSAGASTRSARNPGASVATASPLPSPATTFSPAPATAYAPLTTTTPPAATRSEVSSWSNRKAAAVRWMSANRLATLLGALILLSLLLYLASAFGRRKQDVVQPKTAKTKVQPKFSPDEKLEELPSARATEPAIEQPPKQENAAAPAEAQAAAAGATHDQPRILTRPTIVAPKGDSGERGAVLEKSANQEEREVFEL